MNQETLLDRSASLARVGGDTELLSEIAALFLSEYPHQLADLAAAIDQANPVVVERTAHALKGSIATFGAPPAVQAALSLEQAGRAGDLSHATELLAELQANLGVLHGELASL
jgi:HPt (histidine-containing phosphotransfer) domain-containing protein